MRDLIKILAAGVLLSAYALIVPSLIEAGPAAASSVARGTVGPEKPFPQRLVQAGGDAPVSAVTGGPLARPAPDRIAGLPRFVRIGAAR